MISWVDVAAFLVTTFALLALWVVFTALPVMLLWNWIMPAVFGLGKVTFLQALGINFLAGLLFRTTVKSPSA